MYAETGGVDYSQLLATWRQVLTDAEATHLERFRLERDRRDYLAAHVLLRLALAQERGLDPLTITPRATEGWSLTHTEGLVACAIAAGPRQSVGIDAEAITAAERLGEIADIFLTDHERAALPRDRQARDSRMVETWTAKEAVLKALGEGFSGRDGFGVLSRLETARLENLDEWATISVRDARTGAAYSVWRRWVGDHAIATVATEGNEGTPRLRFLRLQAN